jgi:serine/threonine protein kinase
MDFVQHDPDGRPIPTYYLVLEYCDGGDLAEFLASQRRSGGRGIDEATARRLLRMLAWGLKEMHKRNIIHVWHHNSQFNPCNWDS